MLATLRRVRIVTGFASALTFALFTVSKIGSIVFSSGKEGFLGGLEPLVLGIAVALLAITILSIPFLRARTRNN